MEKKIIRGKLEAIRKESFKGPGGYKGAYCYCMDSCGECNPKVKFWCDVILLIIKLQERIILRICPEDEENG